MVPKNYIPDGFSLGSISLIEEGIILSDPIIPENNFDIFIENDKGINFGKPSKKGNDIFLPAFGDFNSKDLLEKWGLFIIISGAISNIIDRIINGYVIDFIYLHISNFYWPAFNFADIYISIGILMVIINIINKFKNNN